MRGGSSGRGGAAARCIDTVRGAAVRFGNTLRGAAAWFVNALRGAAIRFVDAHGVAARSDRGSATVWSVGAIAVLCVVFGAVLGLGQAVVVRHRAAGGADLAALAAADHWADGSETACARAEGIARAQGTRLVRCVVVGEISDVTAASGRGPFTADIRARAGPAGPVPPLTPLPVPTGVPVPPPAVPAAPAAPPAAAP